MAACCCFSARTALCRTATPRKSGACSAHSPDKVSRSGSYTRIRQSRPPPYGTTFRRLAIPDTWCGIQTTCSSGWRAPQSLRKPRFWTRVDASSTTAASTTDLPASASIGRLRPNTPSKNPRRDALGKPSPQTGCPRRRLFHHRSQMRLGFSGAVAFAALSTVTSIAIPGPAAQDTPAAVTFTRHVARLIFDRCAQCHQPNGSAPFSLLSYADVRQRATQIAAVTRSRYMPPWKATPESGEFVGQRHLSDAEIGLIQRWIDGGQLEGNPRDLPPAPRQTLGWQLGTPDLILTMPSYSLSAEGTDVFRTFVL